jgi:hypothetical protein
MSIVEPRSIATEAPVRTGMRLAWLVWLATIGLTAAGLALLVVVGDRKLPDSYGFRGFSALFALSFGSVGAIVLTRRPGNRVGLVLLAAGVGAGFQTFYTQYAYVAFLVAPGSLPFANVAAWLPSWAWVPFVFLAGPVLMSIFPDGRLVSPRWKLALQLAGVMAVVMMLLSAFQSGPIQNFPILDNPFGVIPRALADATVTPIALSMSLGMLAPAVSLVVRFRRSDRDRRQQLKWFAIAGVVVGLVAPLGFVGGQAGAVIFIVALNGLPIAAGIAVLRYGLYEIDTIINRALVYGLLTAVIAGLYTASIGLMQRVSHALTGADSEATIVVTTIVIVTAFTPIKTRLQALVDRRFKEAADPRVRLEAFAKTLRERIWTLDPQLTIERLVELIVAVVGAASGEIVLERARPTLTASASGSSPARGDGGWSTVSTSGATRLALTLVAAGRPLTDRDRTAVADVVAAVAQELDRA